MFSKKTRALKFLFIFSLVAVVVFCLSTQGAFAAAVDINSASQKELEGLKGIGAAKAKKIIANRPYSSVDELSKAGLSKKDIDTIRPNVTAGTATAKTETKKSSKTNEKAAAGIVDINSASQKELEGLKGIGAAKAKKIIANRPYSSVDELSKAGLSKKDIDTIRPNVTAGTAATKAETKPAADKKTAKTEKSKTQKLAPGEKVNINTASKEKIEALPEIGPKKAQAIIDARPFKTKEDIMKVKGIKQKTYDKIKDSITVD